MVLRASITIYAGLTRSAPATKWAVHLGQKLGASPALAFCDSDVDPT